jgi:hypothetical protein
MSFTKIARANAARARRAAQLAAQQFVTATKLPERPESLLAAVYLTPLITFDGRNNEVLMISPRAEMPDHADQ